MSTYSTYLERA